MILCIPKAQKNQIKIKKTSGKDDQDERVVSSPKHDGDGKNTRRKMQNLTFFCKSLFIYILHDPKKLLVIVLSVCESYLHYPCVSVNVIETKLI